MTRPFDLRSATYDLRLKTDLKDAISPVVNGRSKSSTTAYTSAKPTPAPTYSANQVIGLLEEIIGKPAQVQYAPPRPGEQSRTLADTTLAQQRLGFTPQMSLREGLTEQVRWQASES